MEAHEIQIENNRLNAKETLQKHLTNEIFIALVGHVGSGISFIANILKNQLSDEGFKVDIIKASTAIDNWRKQFSSETVINQLSPQEKTINFQDLGDKMRDKSGGAAVAQGVLSLIREKRASFHGKKTVGDEIIEPNGEKCAYIIDSLKHPEEVELLRHIYGETFSLIGVVCFENVRIERLSYKYFQQSGKKLLTQNQKDKIKEVMDRDANDSKNSSGQHVTDAFWESDYFINNTPSKDSKEPSEFTVYEDIGRFVDFITNSRIVRPTLDETGMHIAFSSQLRSSCLSKQVGSSILDNEGNILVTGCNEVPKAGGGVYGEIFNNNKVTDSEQTDGRCFVCNKVCSSNVEQNEIAKKLLDAFPEMRSLYPKNDDIIQKLRKLGLGSLLEFSRAVHAEMDSITSAARKGISLKGTKMFVTTYPCHYCSRHIVASGISEVQFIEPYPKSLAMKLHSDAISNTKEENKVLFTPFVGVAPRMYEKAFKKDIELKCKVTGDLNINPESLNKWSSYRITYAKLEFELSKIEKK